MHCRKPILGALVVIILILIPGVSPAQEVILRNIVVENVEGATQVRFGLQTSDSQKLAPYLNQGSDLRLICTAILTRERSFWWNRQLQSSRKELRLEYRSLEEEYRIYQEGSESYESRDGDLNRMLDEALGSMSMDLGPWLEEFETLNIVLDFNIRMVREDVPSWLKRTLFFWSWDVVPEKEYRIQFGN